MRSILIKRPRRPRVFRPILSAQDYCHDEHICADCMACFAAEAEYNRPDHAWRVENGKIVYMEDDIMAHHLGRPLKPTESVVHRNGDVKDNRFENLELVNIENLNK